MLFVCGSAQTEPLPEVSAVLLLFLWEALWVFPIMSFHNLLVDCRLVLDGTLCYIFLSFTGTLVQDGTLENKARRSETGDSGTRSGGREEEPPTPTRPLQRTRGTSRLGSDSSRLECKHRSGIRCWFHTPPPAFREGRFKSWGWRDSKLMLPCLQV